MSQQMITTKQYVKVEMKDAIANISINDVPFIKNLETDGFITTEPVNLWLKNDENTLSITIYQNNKSVDYSPVVSATVFIHDEKQDVPTPLKTLATIQFNIETKSEIKYPVTKSVKFKINTKIKTELWNDAEKINEINAQDKTEMIDIAKKLSKSILNDTKQAIDLQLYKLQDDALAEDKTVERFKEVATKSYQWLRTQKDLKIDDIEIGKMKFNICGNNRLVNMVRDNNEEAIIFESDEMFFDIGLYFAKINGNWTIVR
ncbi:MAG: hypothetical protein QM500_11125 [Methylococcales bacterium]